MQQHLGLTSYIITVIVSTSYANEATVVEVTCQMKTTFRSFALQFEAPHNPMGGGIHFSNTAVLAVHTREASVKKQFAVIRYMYSCVNQ